MCFTDVLLSELYLNYVFPSSALQAEVDAIRGGQIHRHLVAQPASFCHRQETDLHLLGAGTVLSGSWLGNQRSRNQVQNGDIKAKILHVSILLSVGESA